MPSPLDSHIDSKASKQEVQSDVARAAQTAQQMRGTVPSHIEEFLGELMQPSLRFTDLIRSSMMKKIQDAGMINDWKHFRRRYLVGSKGRMRQYLPKRHTHKPRYLAGLDTSGSMSDKDMVFGVSQLQALGNSEGLVVPMDAEPHWDAATPIENAGDLKTVKIKGRGGTVFDDFFRDFAKKVGKEWDCIIILTDGDCGTIPIELKPPIDVVWVLTRNHRDFKPTFGRVAPLRRANNVVGEDD
jgi:predicted metal-dependent peptidase